MTENFPTTTAVSTAATSTVLPIIWWAASAMHLAIPANAELSLAVGVVTGAHWIAKIVEARTSGKSIVNQLTGKN